MADSTTDRAIGRLEGKMEEVLRLLQESSASRGQLAKAVEDIRTETSALGTRLGTVEKAIQVMDPLVQEFGRIKERWRGIALILGVIWLILGGLILQGITWVGGLVWRALGGGA